MYPRTNYEMTEKDEKELLDACKPVETEDQRVERIKREEEDKRLQKIEELKAERASINKELAGLESEAQKEGGYMSIDEETLPEDVRLFIYNVTLFLQTSRAADIEKKTLFQQAYRLYSKYKVERY